MTKTNRRRLLISSITAVLILTGCSKDHLDPTQIGRFRPAPAVNVILDSLGVAEETSADYENAEDPTPADVAAHQEDYSFSSGDIVRISIFELLREGQQYIDDYVVNESGNISIPEIGQMQAAGLTETQLEEEIRNALSPGILKNPSVTVSLQSSQSRAFTVLGDGIPNPNRYGIPRYDFRLMDALAVAGSARQFNVSYIYVERRITGTEPFDDIGGIETQENFKPVSPSSAEQIDTGDKEQIDIDSVDKEMLEIIEPTFSAAKANGLVIATAEMATKEELEELAVPETVGTPKETDDIPVGNTMPQTQDKQAEIEWVFKDGKWTPVKIGQEQPAEIKPQVRQQPAAPPVKEEKTRTVKRKMKEARWEDVQSAGIQNRVIRIPKDKLYGGDPRYNIVIKPQDTIIVRLDVIGEFYVLGNVNNQGVVNLTGRPMTLKMAIAAAGGLGQLAWPKKCEVVRRIGEKREEIVMVDLEKIANGTQPDFFIKPNDVINVGTHGIARYLAVLRNAFRATYGFGFIYDRNFSNRPLMLGHPGRLLDNGSSL